MITSFADLLPLLPLLTVTGAAVGVMLAISLWRQYRFIMLLSLGGLLLTALSAFWLLDGPAQQVTPLIIVDRFNLFFTILVSLAAACVAVFSYSYLKDLNDSREEYYLLLLIATIGAVVMVGSNHFVSVILGLETLGMCMYALIAYPLHGRLKASDAANHSPLEGESAKQGRSPQLSRWGEKIPDTAIKPLEAAVKYLVLSAAASACILFGMALVYAQTGSLAFVELVSADGAASGSGMLTVALLLITAGIAFKLSLVPFHIWTPDVYEGAPVPATAYLATVGKAAMFVVLLRFVESSGAFRHDSILLVYSLIAAASILAGNLLALLQENLKRLLAYSSIAHVGYLLIALIAGYRAAGTLSVEAAAFYLLAYTVMTLGAFGLVSGLSSSGRELEEVADYRGLFWRRPWLALLFTGVLLSLAGIPLTIGFIGKFYLFFAGVEAGLWWLLAALVAGSGIGLYYYLRIVYRMILPVDSSVDSDAVPVVLEARVGSIATRFTLLLLFIALLGLGVYPAPVMDFIQSISASIR